MKTRHLASLAVTVAVASSTAVFADVKSQERTKVQFEGALGKVVNLFGGRAARDGIVNTVAVKGDRMITTNDTTGEIVDLKEEKVYQLDMKKKTYEAVTFAELRKQFQDAMARAQQQAAQAQREEPKPAEAKPDPAAPQYEVDFSIVESGRPRQIAGFDTKESIATVTVREKGKTLEEAGGMILEASMWMAPEITALDELQAFRVRYAQQVYGPAVAEGAANMAQAMTMYPMMKDAMARFQAEGQKLSGTSLLTEMKFQVQAPPEPAGEPGQAAQKKEEPPPTSVGGLLGGIGRRMAKKKTEEKPAESNAVPGRATVLTTTAETLQVATSVADAEVAIPAGFKPK